MATQYPNANHPLGKGPRTFQEVRRKRQIAVFLLNTGVRNGELCVLNIEDLRIDDVEQMVRVVGKGMKARWVPLNLAAIAAIHCNLRDRGNPTSGPLFVTPNGDRYNVRQFSSEMVKSARYVDEAIDVNPHNLRHTFATWLARAASDVAIVQKILGHENVNTTLKYYVHTSDSELAGATATLRPAATKVVTRRPALVESSGLIIPFPKIQAV